MKINSWKTQKNQKIMATAETKILKPTLQATTYGRPCLVVQVQPWVL